MQLYKTKIELDKCLNSVKRKIWGFDDLMLSRGAPRQYNVENLVGSKIVDAMLCVGVQDFKVQWHRRFSLLCHSDSQSSIV